MISSILSRLVILVFGTLYPAYASYKAVRTKNVKEYVKWMMYWIVFALFTCIETFTDVFLSWFPFYYEIKIILVIWLLSPATKGSSILYRKFVHPMLSSREQEIDEYISKAKEQSYKQVLDLGSKGMSALMQTAIKGGGGIVNQLKKSYSLSDLSDPIHDQEHDETDIITDPRLIRKRRGRSPLRSGSKTSAIYFSEVDLRTERVANVQSVEDISSGYSSGEVLYAGQPLKLQAREGLQRTGSLTRTRTTRVTRSSASKKSTGSDDSDENEIFDTNIIFLNDKIKKINQLDKPDDGSSSENEFFDTTTDYGLHGNIDGLNDLNNCKITACDQNHLNLDLTKNPSVLTTSESHEKIIVEKKDLNILNITEDVNTFSNFVQNLIETKAQEDIESVSKVPEIGKIPDSIQKSDDVDEKVSESDTIGENLDESLIIRKISEPITIRDAKISKEVTKKATIIEKIPKTSEISKEITNDDKILAKSKEAVPKIPEREKNKDATSQIKEKSGETLTDSKPENRAGKYHKKAAPLPPQKPENASAIKATLVLKPGVVKNLGGSAENLTKQIFLHSPKSRRKSRTRSPSSSSSGSSTGHHSKTKMEEALSKMLMLPKKIGHLNLPAKIHEKRQSWHDFFHKDSKKILASRIHSKSDNNLNEQCENTHVSLASFKSTGSQVSLRSLKESPLAHRRLKIIRTYVDEDID